MRYIYRKAGNTFVFCLFLLLLNATVPAVAQSPTEKAWTVLQSGLSNKSTDNRAIAVSLLGTLGSNPKALEAAATALGDGKPEVRAAAADAIGQMKAKSMSPKLEQIAQTDTDAGVVMASARALIAMGNPLGYGVYYAVLTGERKSGAGLMEEQKKMLKDPKKVAQFGFEQGIGFIPFAGLGFGLVRAVTKDDVSPVRAAAARVLANDPDPRTTQALETATTDQSWLVRTAAIDALAQRNDRSAIPTLEPRMDDEKEAVRYAAAVAIIHLSDVQKKKPATKRK
ncbi:MAG TPA: HEAT repeat domain-containing protein [Edaphobacter sp.]|jgi:HEAT repeat protein|nr:HEAT repeat domain-containing protein [Edaphobacter sp.]